MIKPLARLGVVVVAVASAVWLDPATVAIVAWRSSGPSRLAYLSPLSNFWAALAATIAVVAFAAYIWRRLGRTLDELAHILSPLSLLLLWMVPFAPWIADRAPTLLVFAGPLRWAVAAVAVVGVVSAARRTLKRPGGPERLAILANIRPSTGESHLPSHSSCTPRWGFGTPHNPASTVTRHITSSSPTVFSSTTIWTFPTITNAAITPHSSRRFCVQIICGGASTKRCIPFTRRGSRRCSCRPTRWRERQAPSSSSHCLPQWRRS